MKKKKIPSSEQYFDNKNHPLIPGQIYLFRNSYGEESYYVPCSRPSQLFPTWNCSGLNSNSCRNFSINEIKSFELVDSELVANKLEEMAKKIRKIPSANQRN